MMGGTAPTSAPATCPTKVEINVWIAVILRIDSREAPMDDRVSRWDRESAKVRTVVSMPMAMSMTIAIPVPRFTMVRPIREGPESSTRVLVGPEAAVNDRLMALRSWALIPCGVRAHMSPPLVWTS